MRTALLATAAAVLGLLTRSSLDPNSRPPLRETRLLPPAELRIATLNFDSIGADVLWVRFIQNLPDTQADPDQGEWLARQLTAVVDLDPDFRSAYLNGTVLLDVLADQPCEALRILERGIQRFPSDWRMRFQAGFICFAEVSDSECAAKHLRAAAAAPDGPRWLPGLVGRLLVESSQTEAAVVYLRVELARATDPRLRERFEERLKEATLTHDLEKIGTALRTWRLRNGGEVPSSLNVLVEERLLLGIPSVDPFGGTYEIGPEGHVRSTSGRAALHAHRSDSPFYNTTAERITKERVFARIREALGRPPWLLFPADRVFAAAGHFEYVAQALEILDATDPDEQRTTERLASKARLVLRVELEKLQAAQLSLLRKYPGRRATLPEIAAEAGVLLLDPFGDPYRIDAEGQPATDPRRRRLVLMRESEGGGPGCR